MKNRIWILVVVLLIVSIGALSGFCVAKSINRIAEHISTDAESPDVEKGIYSMFSKMGISRDQLSGYSSIEEAIMSIDKPIRVENIGFTSDEITAMMNISKEYLKSVYVSSIVCNIQPDDTVNFDIYVDIEALGETSGIKKFALSIIQNTKFTFFTTINGVTEDGMLIINVKNIYAENLPILDYGIANQFLGNRFDKIISMVMGEHMLNFPVMKELKSFTISNGLAYIDFIFQNSGATGD